MKRLLNSFMDSTRATKLMIFATVVAALRFMLLHAVAVGHPLGEAFKVAEMSSGVAFAVLEGVALAYVSKRWRKLHPAGLTGWTYWVVLGIGQLMLLLAITWTTGMAFMAVRQAQLIDDVLTGAAAAWWSMLEAGINPLIVLLIGIVEDDEPQKDTDKAPKFVIPADVQAQVFLSQWREKHGNEPTVPEFVHYFEDNTGLKVDIETADRYILDWRKVNGVAGARPIRAKLPVPAGHNGNGSKG